MTGSRKNSPWSARCLMTARVLGKQWTSICRFRGRHSTDVRINAASKRNTSKTDFMTTTTLSPDRKSRRLSAFTLAEVMIGVSVSAFIMAGVMSTFLFLGRSGANIQNYNDMEAQARQALEVFAQDTRQASSIT